VAKLDSIRKKQAEREGANVAPRKNKRARADDLLDSLATIQQQQMQQAELLNTLLVRMSSPCEVHLQPPTPPSPASTAPLSLETAFQYLLEAYNHVDPNERPKKMRRLCKDLSGDDQKSMEEIGCVLSDLSDKSSQRVDTSPKVLPSAVPAELESFLVGDDSFEESSSPSDQSCSHQRELENWNSVLHDFLMQDYDDDA